MVLPPPAETTAFGNVIGFLKDLGVYEIILPFLLIFTIVYAILEKTKIYGTEKVEGKEYTRKNLNAMTAFVMAFFVVASTRLVATISQVMASTVLLLLLSVCFLLLVGSFHTGKEEFALKGGWKKLFMWIMFIGIVLVFLYAIKTGDGISWLEIILGSLFYNLNSVMVSSIILVVIVVVAIVFITGGFDRKKDDDKKED